MRIIVKSYIFSLAFLLLGINAFAQAPLKIGYVDSEVILTQFSEAIKAQGDLDAFTKKLTDQRDSLQLAFQQAYADYQKQGQTMAPDKKAAAEQKLVQMDNDFRQWTQEKFAQGTGEVYKKQEELLAPVKAKIYAAIQKVAKDENMQFVFDKSGDILLLYADSAFDITYKVLDNLKRGTK
jgi:outer membrane protein